VRRPERRSPAPVSQPQGVWIPKPTFCFTDDGQYHRRPGAARERGPGARAIASSVRIVGTSGDLRLAFALYLLDEGGAFTRSV
jgi:hypothetical protein